MTRKTKVLDLRRSYGIECSEFCFEVESGITVADGWKMINEIIGSSIVKRCSTPSVRFPVNAEIAETIKKFKLKNTELVFELAVKPSRIKEFEQIDRLWKAVRENRDNIRAIEFIVEDVEKGSGEGVVEWENHVTPDSDFNTVRKQILEDYEQMLDYGFEEDLDEMFIYKIQFFGEEGFLPTFCNTQFIDEERRLQYTGVSKKIGAALPAFDFDFKIWFGVDWNIRFYDKYSREHTEVYVDWCSLVLEKTEDKVRVYTEGHTDLTGQEFQIIKTIDRVTGR